MNINKYTKTDLYKIANNLLWTWDFEVRELFKKIDSEKWETTVNNPIKLLDEIDETEVVKLFNDNDFLSLFEKVNHKLDDYLKNKSWYAKNFNTEKDLKIAYFSAEFGLTECIRIYSGGLGVLSGDHLKSASDLGLPLVGVGLLYSNGYFQQKLDKDGWQNEFYIIEDFNKLPIELQLDENKKPIIVKIKIADEII